MISTLLRFKLDLRFLSKHLAFNFWMPRSFLPFGKECLPNLIHSLSAPSQWLSSLLFWLSDQEMDFINFSLQSGGCTWGDPKSHSTISSKGRGTLCRKSQKGGKREEMKSGFDEFSHTSALEECQHWWSSSSSAFTGSLECTSIQPSLPLVRGLAFDDSAASRLPGEI